MKASSVLFMMLLFAASAGAVSINESEIPWNESFSKNITGTPNQTINISRIDTTPLNTSFDENITLNATGVGVASFNLSLDTVPASNSSYTASFNLSSGNTSFIHNITVNVSVEQIVNVTKDHFIGVEGENYVINITTNFLPFEGKVQYNVSGLTGERLNISCQGRGEWLKCPEKKTFGQGNMTEVVMSYRIPLSASLGNRTWNVTFKTANLTRKSEIMFIVKQPDVKFTSYTWSDDCFVLSKDDEVAIKQSCWEEREEFEKRRIQQLYDRLRAVSNVTCEEPEVKKEYVVVGNLSKDLKEQYQQCKETRKSLQEEVREVNSNYNELSEDYDEYRRNASEQLRQCAEEKVWQKAKQVNTGQRNLALTIALIIAGFIGIIATIWIIKTKKRTDESIPWK